MHDPMEAIRVSFFAECDEHLASLIDGLDALSAGTGDAETINVVFRAVHSIKGGAAAFGFDTLVTFAHSFEGALDAVRSGRIALDGDTLRLFYRAADLLSDHTHAARDGTAPGQSADTNAIAALDALSQGEPEAPGFGILASEETDLGDFGTPPSSTSTWVIRFAPKPEFFETGNDPLFLFRALREMGELSVVPDLDALPTLDTYDPMRAYLAWDLRLITDETKSTIAEVFEFVEDLCDLRIEAPEIAPEATPDTDTAQTPARAPSGVSAIQPTRPTVRVDLERIDRLVNMVGELVINQAMLAQSVKEAGLAAISPIATGLDEFLQLTRDIQENIMSIRAQPIKPLFQRMGRIVREAAAATGKDVRLVTHGEATEIDKTVIDVLAEPLTHMIRNAIDHGLETPAARRAAGKPEQGTITLGATHRSGRVVVEISDDGAGIDRTRARKRAVEAGLITHEDILDDTEIDQLLFRPGFSTASQVSNMSGRGVGMDIVKTAIASLGGRIVISSTPGRGTSFAISLPLTLAVLDGMVVKVAGETLVVPLTAIIETLMVAHDGIRAVGPTSKVIRVRDTFAPLVDLGAELGYREPLETYAGNIALLIAQEDDAPIALVVDAIDDQRQVVVKGLRESYGRIPGVAAATILGDGRIALILDTMDLMASATGRARQISRPAALAG